MNRIFRPLFGFVFAAAIAAAVLPAGASAEPARFVSVIDDLPLMPGLDEDLDAAMSFDSADGRIAEAEASGALAAAAVRAYYDETLPQLGWRRREDGRFQRGDEQLRVLVDAATAGVVEVRFELRPGAP